MTATFSVKNFDRFQHYKDRSPPWIKLYNELLEDYAFGALPDSAKGQLLSIWILASRMGNKLPCDPRWLAQKINATCPVDLELFFSTGFLVPFEADAAKGKLEDWSSRYVSAAVRAELLSEAGNKCKSCRSSDHLEIDHIIPISQGGDGEKENLQVLCRSCNRKKRASLTYAQAEQLATQIRRPERERETQVQTETERETEIEIEIETTTTPAATAEFNEFFSAMPRREGRDAAVVVYEKMVSEVDHKTLLEAARTYRAAVFGWEQRFILTPVRWLEGRRWTDGTASAQASPFTSQEEVEAQRALKEKAYGGTRN